MLTIFRNCSGLVAIYVFYFLAGTMQARAQGNFSIHIQQVSMPNMPKVQSGAWGRHNGKWVFIGGRVNGLHGFHPPLAFPSDGKNNNILVYDPVNDLTWSSSLDSLSDNLREPLSSSNMQFYQEDSTLYMIGGYGWQNSYNNFVTFSTLTAINLADLIEAVVAGTPVNNYFRQLSDSNLAICGAHVDKIDSVYHLVFGHKFMGIYNRNTIPGFFIQNYSNQVRRFVIHDDGTNLSISNYSVSTDTINFHRRDFNLVPQIFPNGEYGFTAFTGVFQYGINQPYLNTVDIGHNWELTNSNFNQNLSQYHSAVMPVYDSASNYMHSIFFGGMSKYTLDTVSQTLVIDSLVPFVNTISKVSRDNFGNMTEYKLPVSMPGLMGTNSHFILLSSTPTLHGKIIDLNALSGNVLVGYIVGGIVSPEPNISDTDPSVSEATPFVLGVYIDKTTVSANEIQVKEPVVLKAYPNPSKSLFNFSVSETYANKPVFIKISDLYGRKLAILCDEIIPKGGKLFTWDASSYPPGIYYYHVKCGNFVKTERILLSK